MHTCIAYRRIIYFQLLLLLLLLSYLYMWFDIIHMKKKREKWAHVKRKQVGIIVNTKRKCYVAPGHLYSSISIIDFVCIVQNDCVIRYMSSGTTYTPFCIVSRDDDMVLVVVSSLFSLSLLSLSLYIYMCVHYYC